MYSMAAAKSKNVKNNANEQVKGRGFGIVDLFQSVHWFAFSLIKMIINYTTSP
jgi:hypothetical protein